MSILPPKRKHTLEPPLIATSFRHLDLPLADGYGRKLSSGEKVSLTSHGHLRLG